jgi:predicted NUDIX family NTP pyrophosphohydrolase
MSAEAKRSAGLLMYRRAKDGSLEVFLAHPGGPFFKKKDAGVWTIPKGEPQAGEDARLCALREFEEETGMRPKALQFVDLGTVRQRAGKLVQAWAFEGDWQGRELRSNSFEVEWPPRSGRRQTFPEIDRVEFFSIEAARSKINQAQVEFLDRLCALLADGQG